MKVCGNIQYVYSNSSVRIIKSTTIRMRRTNNKIIYCSFLPTNLPHLLLVEETKKMKKSKKFEGNTAIYSF